MVVGICVRIGEHPGDLVQAELKLPVEQDLLEPAQVVRGIQPVAGWAAAARDQKPDLVIVVQGAHRHVRQPSYFSDGVLVHTAYCAASRRVRVKSASVCQMPPLRSPMRSEPGPRSALAASSSWRT